MLVLKISSLNNCLKSYMTNNTLGTKYQGYGPSSALVWEAGSALEWLLDPDLSALQIWRATDAHTGGVEAENGGLEGL
jgi:hypothetical protein